MANPCDARERVDELLPAGAVAGEHAPALGRDAIEPAAALAGFLDPAPDDESALLQPVEHGVERGDVELEDAVGALVDELADLVAVAGALLDEREHEELGAPLLEVRTNVSRRHICDRNIYDGQSSRTVDFAVRCSLSARRSPLAVGRWPLAVTFDSSMVRSFDGSVVRWVDSSRTIDLCPSTNTSARIARSRSKCS